MKRNIYYRYNPETDNYERVYPTIGQRIRKILLFGISSLGMGILIFFLVNFIWGSPTEKSLREENRQLRKEYQVMNRRLENGLKVMKDIQHRDDNFYRVLMQMDPLGESQRIAGVDNESRYRALRRLSDGELVTLMARRLDLFERQLYAQSLSFDEIKQVATKSPDRLAHIPSVLPLERGTDYLSGGFGVRRDPISGDRKFHAGHDFLVSWGTPVRATADGTVKAASREGGYGNLVEIDHGYNYKTRYAHLSDIKVTPGESVHRGDIIGAVGSTGSSAAPHLHYEVIFRDEPQNPVNYYFNELTPQDYSGMVRKAENASQILD